MNPESSIQKINAGVFRLNYENKLNYNKNTKLIEVIIFFFNFLFKHITAIMYINYIRIPIIIFNIIDNLLITYMFYNT